MSTDHYADAGLRYLPIDRVGEFPECLDGRPVLVRYERGGKQTDVGYSLAFWDAAIGAWRDYDHPEDCHAYIVEFLPVSLAPIGEHVVVEYAVCRSREKRRFSVSGHSDHGVSEWIGDGKDVVQTGVVRIPIRRPPHGEAP